MKTKQLYGKIGRFNTLKKLMSTLVELTLILHLIAPRYGTASNFETYKADYIKLYVDTIKKIINEEDPARPFTVSSPSNGKRSEEEDYVSLNPGSPEYGDGWLFF